MKTLKAMMKIILTAFLGLFLTNSYPAPFGVYREDDRKDYFEITDPRIKEISKSTVAIMFKDELLELPNGNFIKKDPETLIQQDGMCSKSKFSSQVTYGHCSGSLIDKDIILTAAHCFSTGNDSSGFKNMYVVFDLSLQSSEQTQIEIKKENVFEMKEVLYYDLYENLGQIDLTTVRLNRVVDRTPLRVNRNFDYQIGTNIFMLGYPIGLPLKYTNNATISKINTAGHSFHNDLDAFSGNSGSSIFDAVSNEIIGVLVRGRSENFMKTEEGCNVWGIGKNADTEEGMLLWDLPII